ncbi:MAG: winged helix-turn-helix domain-containing protein [Chloroflexi bacterium]|nr:winged helix-turn-helix domain-containing protein [Chloroflexota bacterium]
MDSLKVNAESCNAAYGGSTLQLSPREAALLAALIDSGDRVLSRAELIARVWGEQQASSRAVDVNIHRLRTKLQRAGHPGIKTVFQRGYVLAA